MTQEQEILDTMALKLEEAMRGTLAAQVTGSEVVLRRWILQHTDAWREAKISQDRALEQTMGYGQISRLTPIVRP